MRADELDTAFELAPYVVPAMAALETARDAMALISGVSSCKVGLEANISPADYPLIRLVPSLITPGKPYTGRTIETLIYFGVPLTLSEGLEQVYAQTLWLEDAIRAALKPLQGRYIDTRTDEDRLDAYKLMVVRCELAE